MAIFEQLKSIANTLRKADKIDEYQAILDAQEKLLDNQKRIAALESENAALKERQSLKENLIFANNAYWAADKKDGPYCSRCFDKNNDAIRMHPCGNKAFSVCPECKNNVQTDPNNKPQNASFSIKPINYL